MKDIPLFAVTLTLVAAISAGSLAWLDKITRPRILEEQRLELQAGILEVLPGASRDAIFPVKDEENNVILYSGYKDAGKNHLVGYALPVVSRGYSSDIRSIVGIDSTFSNILAIKVLSQKETPGLGTRCQEIKSGESDPWFQRQFHDKVVEGLAVDKDGGTIQSITAATITSRAITDGISHQIEKAKLNFSDKL